MSKKFSTDLFDRIKPEKREMILNVATKEFAKYGFNSANINIIAEKAGVSVGAIYKYFETKENLFLTTIHEGISYLEAVLEKILTKPISFFDKIDEIILTIQKHSRENSDIIRLYNELTTEANADLVKRLSMDTESVSAKYYTELIQQGQNEAVLTSNVPASVMAFFLDNIFLMLQFSYGCEYYQERLRIFLGDNAFDSDANIRKSILYLLKQSFSYTK